MAKILLIEPDAVLARTYSQALLYAGHAVTHALSAQEAVDAADQDLPDIVVLELQIPVHDGVEFLQEFRSYPEWHIIPVIVNTILSPAALRPVRQTLEDDLGVTICLYKPRTTLEQLASVIARRLAGAL